MDTIAPWLPVLLLAQLCWLHLEIRWLRRDVTSCFDRIDKRYSDRADKTEEQASDLI